MASYQAQLDSPSRATGFSQPNVGVSERGLSLVGGSSLILYGLRQGGGGGILLALLGGSLVYRGATFIITHRLKLDEGTDAYETFKNKADECIKVVMTP